VITCDFNFFESVGHQVRETIYRFTTVQKIILSEKLNFVLRINLEK